MRILEHVVKRCVGRFGHEIVRPERLLQRALPHHLRCLFARYEIDCVLDVGANRSTAASCATTSADRAP